MSHRGAGDNFANSSTACGVPQKKKKYYGK